MQTRVLKRSRMQVERASNGIIMFINVAHTPKAIITRYDLHYDGQYAKKN